MAKMEGRDGNKTPELERESRVWSEFSEGAGLGWYVCLNTTGFYHVSLLQDYARAYHKAARLVFEGVRQRLQDGEWPKNYREMDAHPIAFLYRQALELYLKTVIVWGEPLQQMLGKPPKQKEQIFKNHNLARLLPGVEEVFGLIDCFSIWTAPAFQSFEDIERVVQAVNDLPHDAFRYPIDPGGSKELLPRGLCFSVLVFAEKLDGLLGLLDAVATRTWGRLQSETSPHIPS